MIRASLSKSRLSRLCSPVREGSTGKPIKTKIENMITKQQELNIINQAIRDLGEKSYLGPWLLSVRHELEAMMRADSFPCISLAKAREDALQIVKEGEQKAEQIIINAKQKAENREAMAQSNVDCAITAIRKAQQVLLSIEERF